MKKNRENSGIETKHQIIINLLLLLLINMFLIRDKIIQAYNLDFDFLDINDKLFITYFVITIILCINLETEFIKIKSMYLINFLYLILVIFVVFYNMIFIKTFGNTRVILNFFRILITLSSIVIFVLMLKDTVLDNENTMLINIISPNIKNDKNYVKRNNIAFSLLINLILIFYVFYFTLIMLNN